VFSQSGVIKIADFGYQAIAKAYMSPEAFRWNLDTTTDPRIDIYALGVTLMELLTKQNPFTGLSVENYREAPTSDFPIRNTKLATGKSLKPSIKQPELRFQFMVELKRL
jgi:serine/threonine protein kinase